MFFFNEYSWMAGAIILIFRYFLIAGIAYFVFYIWKKNKLSHLKIQDKFPTSNQLKNEIFFSFLTLLIYSGTSGIVLYWYQKGITKIYLDIADYGIFYLIGSIFLMILIHDTYFYWTHKLMHSYKWLYKFHKIHHLSHNPTPWTAFAFHPAEALISLGIIPLIIFIMPIHPLALVLFLTFMTIYNVLIHLGYEIFSKKKIFHLIGKWKNTTTNHDLHHEIGGGFNYGLYFSIWDRIMGTYKENKDSRFK
ncbi:sterol desaturase family protein [Flavobacterium sp. LB1P62]|uniref:sterol desaturase family protein n=1 Tax=unclassified Flavobacterium TaxID=196869 RepID=UPI003AAD850A